MTKAQKAARAKFHKFCEEHAYTDEFEELNWYDLSIGYFMNSGLTVPEAVELATSVRYDDQYWMEYD